MRRVAKDFFGAFIVWAVVWLVVRFIFPSGFVAQYAGDAYVNWSQEFFLPMAGEGDYLTVMTDLTQYLLLVNVILFVLWYALPLFVPVSAISVPAKAKSFWFALLVGSIGATAASIALSPQLDRGVAPFVVLTTLILMSLLSFYLVSCLASPPGFKYLVPGAARMRRRSRRD